MVEIITIITPGLQAVAEACLKSGLVLRPGICLVCRRKCERAGK